MLKKQCGWFSVFGRLPKEPDVKVFKELQQRKKIFTPVTKCRYFQKSLY